MAASDDHHDADAFLAATHAFSWRAGKHKALPPRRARTFDLSAPLPGHVDLRVSGFLSKPKNQGATNSCTSFAIAAAVEAEVRASTGRSIMLAPWYLHTCVLGAKTNEGASVEEAVDAATRRGIAYTDDCNAPWPKSQCNVSQVFPVRGSETVADARDAKEALATGHPVVCVAMVEWSTFERLKPGEVYRYRPDINGANHCVCLVGYDDARGCWLIQNSYGAGWCDAGFALIGYNACGLLDPAGTESGARLLV